MPSTWRFVDGPTASPTIYLDMNDELAWKTLGGDMFALPSPPLRQSISSNMLTDGGVPTSTAFENRELHFTIEMTGASEADRNAQLVALKTELSKPSNIIMYMPQLAANPVFFLTYRSDDYDVDKQFVPGQAWRVSCVVRAQPFAIGIRRDLTQVTVTNDPASGTNPGLMDVTGVVGDSPTPAFVRLQGLGAGGVAVLAQRTRNNPTALTMYAQAEAGTLGPDTATSGAANTSGGAGAYVTFGTNNNLTDRVTVNVPTATTSDALRGRYRVLLRAHCSDAVSTFSIRYRQYPSGTSVSGGVTTFVGDGSTWFILDLGVIEWPGYQAPAAIGYSALAPAQAAATLAIQAARTAGTGNLDLDYVALLPADERLCSVQQSQAAGYLVLDGPNDMTYGMSSGSTPFGSTRTIDNAGGIVSRIGGIPQLVPSVTNRWYLLRTTATVSTTTTVDVSYWPRWREVATS